MNSVYSRTCRATGARNMQDLASFFGVTEAKISDFKRKGHIPESWLDRLKEAAIDTEWVLSGDGQHKLATEK